MKYGARKKIIVNSTSPAKTLPNNRKDKEIIFLLNRPTFARGEGGACTVKYLVAAAARLHEPLGS